MRRGSVNKGTRRVVEGAASADALPGIFPRLDLPIQPPFPVMEAKLLNDLPADLSGMQVEPKWDGFRCVVFRSGDQIALQSKAGQTLGRYFPELLAMFRQLPQRYFVLDGEIVIMRDGQLSFDDLLLRIHPAESRVRKLAQDSPASYIAFDLLVDDLSMAKTEGGTTLVNLPLRERRDRLERFFKKLPKPANLRRSPYTEDRRTAGRWFHELAGNGFDGVVAKDLNAPYASGERSAMWKIKRLLTADCVVGGFRWASKGGQVGSLLLGLYDDPGKLNHVGFTSSFSAEERKELSKILKPYLGGTGFTGNAPGGPSRWSTERSGQWEKLDPKLVCEVRYDHFSGGRFRHGTKFLRWRPEKAPRQCTYEQFRRDRAVLSKLGLAA